MPVRANVIRPEPPRASRGISASLLALLLFAAEAHAQRPPDSLDAYIEAEMAARHIPGLSLTVVVGGEVVADGGYGAANLELDAPATDPTSYPIASITKTFTAVATIMLVEEGRVILEDPISRHVPGLPEPWRPATVRQLLDHTSGINSLTEHERPPCG